MIQKISKIDLDKMINESNLLKWEKANLVLFLHKGLYDPFGINLLIFIVVIAWGEVNIFGPFIK